MARCLAAAIYRNHVANGRLGCDANHIAVNVPYEEALYRGLLAELAFARLFGLTINDAILDSGDGGLDFVMPLATSQGRREFPVNIKAKSVRVSWPGLMRSGTHLRVPVREIKPLTIYVFGVYLEPTDSALVFRWDWGRTIIDHNHRAVYENSDGTACFIKRFETLRDLRELWNKRA
jgi:hypothetical protein